MGIRITSEVRPADKKKRHTLGYMTFFLWSLTTRSTSKHLDLASRIAVRLSTVYAVVGPFLPRLRVLPVTADDHFTPVLASPHFVYLSDRYIDS